MLIIAAAANLARRRADEDFDADFLGVATRATALRRATH